MSKDMCTPVCLCAPSAQCVFDSCEEVSSVIGIVFLNQWFVFALWVHVQRSFEMEELFMNFVMQVQTWISIKETLWSAGEAFFSEATEKSEVWQEDTRSFSGVIHSAEVLCEVH